ncbi:MAG TPA: hypothetical protein VKZ53_13160 [Candidatus Angelobacter sp.]|nr:hypothetical protein [Candidatus Angelobacter sp.]
MRTSDSRHEADWIPVDFEKAEIAAGDRPGAHILRVRGNTPSGSAAGCPVKLEPQMYVTQPEYWQIQVLWDRREAIFPSLCSYDVSIPLDTIRGTKGVEVTGSNRSLKIDIAQAP